VFCAATAIASPAQVLFTTLHSFSFFDGALPSATLVQGSDGNFYGTTVNGGAYQNCGTLGGPCGTVFEITPAGALTTLHNFDYTDGGGPRAGLLQGADGNLYGTTYGGGSGQQCIEGCGTVFKITPSGTLTTLHNFDGSDGAYPNAALIQASDGNFYGTTYEGGANRQGTVFKITPGGTLTTLYSFSGADGASPSGGLMQSRDGSFHGTTYAGGASGNCSGGCGTVFKITPGGTLTTLYSFCSQSGCTDGEWPSAGLVQGTDGNFYGTTEYGGTSQNCFHGCGTVFKITPAGALTTLHSFSGADGASPSAGLVQTTDGNFYGTTGTGGDLACNSGLGCGTVFKVVPRGILTTLHSFGGSDGAFPYAALTQATDRNLYGTTWGGGAYFDGTVFRLVTVRPCIVCASVE
jgi:uncharacterized repeat protein (TIGR03803 family)